MIKRQLEGFHLESPLSLPETPASETARDVPNRRVTKTLPRYPRVLTKASQER
jgi:hypothetical protein